MGQAAGSLHQQRASIPPASACWTFWISLPIYGLCWPRRGYTRPHRNHGQAPVCVAQSLPNSKASGWL